MATTATFQPGESTSIDTTLASTGFYTVSTSYLDVGFESPTKLRSVMVWDLTSLPDTAFVTSATLTLYNSTDSLGGDTDVYLYRITEDGVDEAATWDDYAFRESWATAGGDYTTTDGVTATVVAGGNLVGTGANLESLIHDALTNQGGYLRLIVISSTEGTSSGSERMRFHSATAATGSDRPQLIISYVDVTSWTGAAGDFDATNGSNWSRGTPNPTTRAIINETSDDITTPGGGLRCKSLYIGPKFTGKLGTTASSAVVQADYVYIDSVACQVHVNHSKWTASSELVLINTPRSESMTTVDGDFGTLHLIGTGRRMPMTSSETLTIYGGTVRPALVEVTRATDIHTSVRGDVQATGTVGAVEVHNKGKVRVDGSGTIATLHATTGADIDFRAGGISTAMTLASGAVLDMRDSDQTGTTLTGLEIYSGGLGRMHNGIEAVDFTGSAVTFYGGKAWFDEGVEVNVATLADMH